MHQFHYVQPVNQPFTSPIRLNQFTLHKNPQSNQAHELRWSDRLSSVIVQSLVLFQTRKLSIALFVSIKISQFPHSPALNSVPLHFSTENRTRRMCWEGDKVRYRQGVNSRWDDGLGYGRVCLSENCSVHGDHPQSLSGKEHVQN